MSDAALRDLERAVRGAPAASDWSALARALSRAGRPWDAYGAAVRALTLDATEPVRDLMPAVHSPAPLAVAAPWPGFRRPGPASSFSLVEPSTGLLVDLGHGRLLARTEGGMRALDVFTGLEVWVTDQRLEEPLATEGRVVGRIFTAEAHEVVILDAATGHEQARVVIGPNPREGAGPSGEHVDDVSYARSVMVDRDTLAVVTDHPFDLRVTFVDLITGRIRARARVPGPPREDLAVAIDDAVVVPDGLGLTAIDVDGQRRWTLRVEDNTARTARGVVGDALLIVDHASSGARLQVVDPWTGVVCRTLLPPPAPATGSESPGHWAGLLMTPEFVIANRARASGPRTNLVTTLSPGSGEITWTRHVEATGCSLSASRDALLVSDNVLVLGQRPRHRQPSRVSALDPLTGEELWELTLDVSYGPPRPLGGHLVFQAPGRLLVHSGAWEP